MPFVAVPNVVRAALIYQDADGNEAVNVIHARTLDSPFIDTQLVSLAVGIETWAETDWVGAASAGWTLLRCELRSLETEEGAYLDQDINAVGVATGGPMPAMNTIAVSLRSAFVGRSRRGRLYHVGLSESMVDGEEINAGARVAILNCYNSLRSTLFANDWQLVVVSYVSDGLPRAVPLVTDITSVILTDNRVDQQVRRRPQ